MRLFTAILVGKVISALTRVFKIGGGSAAPGLYALKIDPQIIEKLIKQIPKNIVITGTNGKTTTAKMLALFAKEEGLKVIRNHTGSNLERGIASTLISSVSFGWKLFNPRGWIRSNLGIWELDEAAFNTLALKIKPDVIVFLNAFRDQLDRYGEVDSVVKKWGETLKNLPKNTKFLINGDDANTSKLKGYFKGEVQTFGIKDSKIIGEGLKNKPTKLDYEAQSIKLDGLKGSSFQLLATNYQLPIPGIYHIYDAVAAITSAFLLGLPINKLATHLTKFSPAFGRMEKFDWGYIFLIKNPVGATQVFQTIAPVLQANDRLLIALNDNFADGTDVSWIWDVNFESFQNSSRARAHASAGRRDLSFYVSGTRSYDMAIRLKYAGFAPESINIQPSVERALQEAQRGLKGRLFVLPTYTAMLELQKILTKQGIKEHYWKAEA